MPLDKFYTDNTVSNVKDEAEKVTVSYAAMTTSLKIEYLTDLLAFNKAKLASCSNASSRQCVRADQYRSLEVAWRMLNSYYTEGAARTTLDSTYQTTVVQAAATKLTEDNAAPTGQDVLTLSDLTGSTGIESSVPGYATDGDDASAFSTTMTGGLGFFKGSLSTFITVGSVRVRTSNTFTEAVKL